MKWSEGGTLLLVILGWAATHLFSEARERRKEVRARLDALFKSLRDLQDAAHTFHSAETYSASGAKKLRTDIHWIQRSLTRVGILDDDDLAPYLVSLRRSITLENFEPGTFVGQAEGSEVLESIVDAIADLEDELDRQYVRQYPQSFPFFRVQPRLILNRIRAK